jgi:hypothetical protein
MDFMMNLPIKVPTTLEKMGNKPILEQVLPDYNVMSLGVMPDVQKIGELINGKLNPLDNLLALGLLLLRFASPDSILKLELLKKINFPYH